MTAEPSTASADVLVIAAFGKRVNGQPRPGKVFTHLEPIARAANRVTYVTPGPPAHTSPGIEYRRIRPTQSRFLRLLLQWIVAIRLARSNEYDVIVSFSLFPYGFFALSAKYLSGTPAHLGIIGIDLDVHASGRYGTLVRWAFRRFDVVTVAGEDHRLRLINAGVAPNRAVSVLHPVAPRFAHAGPDDDPAWDVLWIGRMSPEKDPITYVKAIQECHERGQPVTAGMVGRGPVDGTVAAVVRDCGLTTSLSQPGWMPDPIDAYRNAKLLVVTSRREMLPLSLVEAMSVGIPVVAPAIGAIPDVIEDGQDGIIVDNRSPATFATAIMTILDEHDQFADRAAQLPNRLNAESEAQVWRTIFARIDAN